jgi:nicotinamidase-related amidase
MPALALDPKTTALVLIDLQNGILAMPVQPHTSQQLLERSAKLAAALRTAGGTVIYVHVDFAQMTSLPTDAPPMRDPNGPPPPPEASQLSPHCGIQPGDLTVTKRQWGAFYGTNLDQILRRRGIQTILLGGIATNFGVESTARDAFDRAYQVVFIEDAMSTVSPEAHTFAITTTFPRMGRVRSTDEVLAALTPESK